MKKMILLSIIVILVSSLMADDATSKRALKAASLSLILPGGGQIYNGSYLKAGVAFSTEATFLGLVLYNYSQSEKYYDAYQNSGLQVDLDKYNNYYNKRQNYLFWLGASAFISTVDAFVDAHLKDYIDTRNKIHIKLSAQSISLNIKF